MKISQNTMEKVQKDEFDIEAVKEILDEIIKRDFKDKREIKYVLDEHYTKQPYYKEDSLNNPIAYADSECKKNGITTIFADISTFVAVFGTGIENTHNISFPRLSFKYDYPANNYFKIFQLLFHELEHANQDNKYFENYVPVNQYESEIKQGGKKRQKELTELSIHRLSNYYMNLADKDSYQANHELLGIEHEAESEGVYNTIKLFEETFPNQIANLDTVALLLRFLLNEYTLEDNKLISPYDKYLVAGMPFFRKYEALFNLERTFTEKNLSALDNYTLLSYGMPVDKDLFLEVLNMESRNFDSITDCKKYIKKL